MTSKVYRSAQGKMVDLGTIMLRNEHVRAVGNMKVNARGDKIDNTNKVVETRPEQIQRQNDRTTSNVTSALPDTGSKSRTAKKKVDPNTKIRSKGHRHSEPEPVVQEEIVVAPVVEEAPPVAVQAPAVKRTLNTTTKAPPPIIRPPAPPVEVDLANPIRPAKSPAAEVAASTQGGGLAGAIARSREIKQDLDRTRRQQARDRGVRKI